MAKRNSGTKGCLSVIATAPEAPRRAEPAGADIGLPVGWARVRLQDICDINPSLPKTVVPTAKVSFVPMAAVSEFSGAIVDAQTREYREVSKGYTPFIEGDVLWAKITPCMENGKAAIARGLENGVGCGSTEFFVLRSNGSVLPELLHRFVRQPNYRQAARKTMNSAVGQARVPKAFLLETPFVLPPVAEQRRIVARLEALEARTSRARTALDAIPPLLAQARQSLLTAAFRGDLTAEWREKNRTNEKAADLKARLAEGRFAAWQRCRERYQQDVDAKHYGVPTPPTEEFVFDMPDEWELVSFDELTTLITSGSRDWKRHYRQDGSGTFIMAQNIRPLFPDFSTRQRVNPPDDRDRIRSQVEEGDILTTIVGANTGDVCRVPRPLPDHYVCQSVALMRPVLPEMSEFLNYYMNSERHGQWQFHEWMYGEGRPHLSFDHLREIAVVLPTIAEQREIGRRLEAAFARLDAAAEAHAAAVAELDRLDQALFAKAFRGELVPQNPADEPATVTLQRLRTPREVFEPFAYLLQFIPALLRASGGALPFVRTLEGCALLLGPRDLIRLLEPIGGATARQHFEKFAQPLKDGSFEPVLRQLIQSGAITHDAKRGHPLRLVEAKAPPVAPLIAEDARHVASVIALVPNEALETLPPARVRKLCAKPAATMLATM